MEQEHVPVVGDTYKHKDGDDYRVVRINNDYTTIAGKLITIVEYTKLDYYEICLRRLEHFNRSFKKIDNV